MPDITMCQTLFCPSSTKCSRHADSGTVASPGRQSYFYNDEYISESLWWNEIHNGLDDGLMPQCSHFVPKKNPNNKEGSHNA